MSVSQDGSISGLPDYGRAPNEERSKICFMAMWKKIAIVVVAWAASVFVYVEFFKGR
jgi:hypothetical protein